MSNEEIKSQEGKAPAQEAGGSFGAKEVEELARKAAEGEATVALEENGQIHKKIQQDVKDPAFKKELENNTSGFENRINEVCQDFDDAVEDTKKQPEKEDSGEGQEPEGAGAGNPEMQKTQDYLNNMHNKENFQEVETGEKNENVGESQEEEVPEEVKRSTEYVERVENHFHRKVDRSEGAEDEDARSKVEKKLIEEYENAEDKEAVIKETKKRYTENLQSLPEYDESKEIKESIVEAQKKIEKRLADAELTKGLENKEIKFNDVIEEGQALLKEGDTEKIADYFGSMADVFEDCSKYAQCIYLQMESDPDPQMREKFKKEYVALVSDIQRLDEAAKALRELANKADTAHKEGVALSEDDLKDMRLLLETLGKAAAFIVGFGAAVYKIAEYSNTLAIAHPTVAKTIGWTFTGIAGRYMLTIPSAAATAKVACVVAAIALVFKERWRDDMMKKICGVGLPFKSLEAPTPAEVKAGKS